MATVRPSILRGADGLAGLPGLLKSHNSLRRYTELPVLLHLLQTKQLTLISPTTWVDQNDAHYLSLYRNRKGLTSLLALCLSRSQETFHHWSVFSRGSSGVCIVFKGHALLSSLLRHSGVSCCPVSYLGLKEIEHCSEDLLLDDLPYLKRLGYKAENEMRIIYESDSEAVEAKGFTIGLDCIERIALSPWLHRNLRAAVEASIQSIEGCSKLKVVQSTLVSDRNWQSFGQQILDRS